MKYKIIEISVEEISMLKILGRVRNDKSGVYLNNHKTAKMRKYF